MRRHYHILAGVLIGVACILPGASGGMLAVAFGLYRPMLEAATRFYRAPGQHIRLLAPLGAGIAAGIVLGAAGLSGAMARHGRLMLFLFTGLILGGIPDLLHEAQAGGRFRPRWLLSLAAGVLTALPLCLPGATGAAVVRLSPMQALTAGILEGVGTVIPGISTSFVLIRLGWYQAYLRCVADMDWQLLAPLASGFAVSALCCLRLAQELFERHTGHAYYAVLGFLLVSVAVVFPGFTLDRELWAQLGMLVIGITVVRLMGNGLYTKR